MVCDPERHLWLWVINQALIDATSSGNGSGYTAKATEGEREIAHIWLTEPSCDRDFVCMMAGVSPREVEEAYYSLCGKSEG